MLLASVCYGVFKMLLASVLSSCASMESVATETLLVEEPTLGGRDTGRQESVAVDVSEPPYKKVKVNFLVSPRAPHLLAQPLLEAPRLLAKSQGDGTAATGSEETQDMKVVGCPSRGLPAPRVESKYFDVCGSRLCLKQELDLTRLPI